MLNSTLSELAEKVLALYRQMDAQTATLQAATGLQCPCGCSQCCENPESEATPLEVLPVALELFRRGEDRAWLERAGEGGAKFCAFYPPDPFIRGNGSCLAYPWRPALRLFGFATANNKQGHSEFAARARHKRDRAGGCPQNPGGDRGGAERSQFFRAFPGTRFLRSQSRALPNAHQPSSCGGHQSSWTDTSVRRTGFRGK